MATPITLRHVARACGYCREVGHADLDCPELDEGAARSIYRDIADRFWWYLQRDAQIQTTIARANLTRELLRDMEGF